MARPAPDLERAKILGAEVRALVGKLGGFKPAERILADAGDPIRWDSLRRYAQGKREAPDDIVAALRKHAANRPRWLTGKDETGAAWLMHMHKPRFLARVIDSEVSIVEWIDEKPEARPIGILAAAATEFVKA